jgi:serine/threonine protein kinase
MSRAPMRDWDGHATAILEPVRGSTLVVVPTPLPIATSADVARIGPHDAIPRAVIGGRYRVVRPLGEGGAGVVYLAVHEVTAREVAIKLLRGDRSPHPRFVERFYRETRWTSKLRHSNIVQILDAGTEDGTLFVVMEYLDGVTLRQRLASGPLPEPRVALTIARAIAEAMAHAHAEGIVHRDLKPENVMLLGPDGSQGVKLLDFGVAAPIEDSDARMTCIGEVLGTPGYMAPEHSSGARATAAFDVYGYGMLLHELLGGDERRQRKGWAWRSSELLIAACTAGDPQRRPRFTEIVERLAGVLDARPGLSLRTSLQGLGRALALAFALAAAGIVLTGAAIVLAALDAPTRELGPVRGIAPPRAEAREAEHAVASPAPPPPTPPSAAPVESSTVVESTATAPRAEPQSAASHHVDCGEQRRRLLEHRAEHRWPEMLTTLSSRSCFSTTEYGRASTRANFELKRFARCARVGADATDPEIVRTTTACRRRLELGRSSAAAKTR